MLEIGQLIGSYRIVRPIGEGGMGAVFEAIHGEIGRHAAIKVLHPQYANDAAVAQRFLNEARAVNLIDHAGVVEIYDLGRLTDGTTYIVMEFLRGESLTSRLERRGGRLSLAEAVHLVRQIASALTAAHEVGIVHRDLKPDNVMVVTDPGHISGERAKILDFGIAKLGATSDSPQDLDPRAAHRLTRTGAVMGTALYMAPEQCIGSGKIDGRADVYSLGIMLFQFLAGRTPFLAEGLGAIMAMHIYESPPALSEMIHDIPSEISALVARLLAKTPADRPTMEELLMLTEAITAAQPFVRSAPPGNAFAVKPFTDAEALTGHRRRSTLSSMAGQRTLPAQGNSGGSRWPRWIALTMLALLCNVSLWQLSRLPDRRPVQSIPAVGKPASGAALGVPALTAVSGASMPAEARRVIAEHEPLAKPSHESTTAIAKDTTARKAAPAAKPGSHRGDRSSRAVRSARSRGAVPAAPQHREQPTDESIPETPSFD